MITEIRNYSNRLGKHSMPTPRFGNEVEQYPFVLRYVYLSAEQKSGRQFNWVRIFLLDLHGASGL